MRTPLKSRTMILAVAVLLVLTSITVAAAQGPGPRGPNARGPQGDMFRNALHRLDLTEDQKASVKALFESNKEAMQAEREKLREARQALRLQTQNETFDEAAIRSLAEKVAAREVEMAVARASLHNQVMQVLTPEQRAELKEMQAKRQERMEEWREEGMRGPRGRRGQGRQPRGDW